MRYKCRKLCPAWHGECGRQRSRPQRWWKEVGCRDALGSERPGRGCPRARVSNVAHWQARVDTDSTSTLTSKSEAHSCGYQVQLHILWLSSWSAPCPPVDFKLAVIRHFERTTCHLSSAEDLTKCSFANQTHLRLQGESPNAAHC